MAQAINDPARFKEMWLDQGDNRRRAQEYNEIHSLDDDINEENQAKIADLIRRQAIQRDIDEVMESDPELFGRVTMLYIDVEINGTPIKAFVDSGAQATIMSPSCAEKCNVTRLIDDRFSGIARGVGTAKILGRVHKTTLKIGDAELTCAFTVMEGKDVEMLLGLDMLKRYQACIDLRQNRLVFQGGVSVPFLPESEIPKSFEEAQDSEPVVPGPGGTTIGTQSGAVKGPGVSGQASSSFAGQGRTLGAAGPAQTVQQPRTESSLPPRPTAPTPSRAAEQFPQEHIDQLQSIGASREQAIEALRACSGDVEYAASLLFSQL